MALKDLLFRCPSCGAFGTSGEKDRVRCDRCGIEVRRGRSAAEFAVLEGDRGGEGRPEGVQASVRPLWELVLDMFRSGGPFPEAERADEAPVIVRRSTSEEVVRYRGEVIGFTEGLGPSSQGVLRVTPTSLELDDGTSIDLLDVRALQASSSSLQIHTVQGVLFHFEFLEDSTYRWEAMIQELLRKAYRAAGKGEIVEFQPRIAVR